MEERHAHVAAVIGSEPHDHPHTVAGHHEPALAADDGLRRGRRARREDQTPDRVGIRLAAAIAGAHGGERVVERGPERGRALVRVSEACAHEQGIGGDRQLVSDRPEQSEVPRFGHDETHVGVHDVTQQMLVATRVVETDHRRSRQCRAAEREEVVGRVIQEHADVQGPISGLAIRT